MSLEWSGLLRPRQVFRRRLEEARIERYYGDGTYKRHSRGKIDAPRIWLLSFPRGRPIGHLTATQLKSLAHKDLFRGDVKPMKGRPLSGPPGHQFGPSGGE